MIIYANNWLNFLPLIFSLFKLFLIWIHFSPVSSPSIWGMLLVEKVIDETIGSPIWNGLHPKSRWPCWWKNYGKKSLLGIWLGYYPKLEQHFSLFWHQNGRVITLRISKNMLRKLRGVIIKRCLLPLAAWQCKLRRYFVQRIELHLHYMSKDRRNFKYPNI